MPDKARYGFKAAPYHIAQLSDRAERAGRLTPGYFICELYLDGLDIKAPDVRKRVIANLAKFKAEYIAHVPLTTGNGDYYDPSSMHPDLIKCLVEISHVSGGGPMILHRSWGADTDISWEDAEKRFNDWIFAVSRANPSFTFLIENFGFVFRPYEGRIVYYLSPLDLFMPYEIKRFNSFLTAAGITNVRPFLDVAHVNLTESLARAWQMDHKEAEKFMHRALWEKMRDEDFRKCGMMDFLKSGVHPYFHISDSLSLPDKAHYSEWERYLLSEGLIPGKGDIDWHGVLKELDAEMKAPVLIMETVMKDPAIGGEQEEAMMFIKDLHEETEK